MKIFIIVAAVTVVAALVAQLVLSSLFTAKVEALRRALLQAQNSPPPDQSLIPQLVRDFALRNGGQVGGATAVVMTQSAEMRLQPDQPFFHIDASQVTGSRAPGFVWHATGMMGGFVPLQVVDSYVGRAGGLEVRIAGSIQLANASGADIDKGEAMRFLAELAWNPDALLNAAGLIWRQVDDRTVEVMLDTNGGPARLNLLFDQHGDIVGIRSEDRPRAVGSASIPTPWIGRFTDYTNAGGLRWPRRGEVGWVLAEGEFIYWRGEILSVAPVGRP